MYKLLLTLGLCLVIIVPTSETCLAGYHKGDRVVLVTEGGCPSCQDAKMELRANLVPFKEIAARFGMVPRLYVNEKYIGMGSDTVDKWIHS